MLHEVTGLDPNLLLVGSAAAVLARAAGQYRSGLGVYEQFGQNGGECDTKFRGKGPNYVKVGRMVRNAFASPVLIHSAPPEGSLRHCAAGEQVPILVYEAGEALRFDEVSIRIGLRGVVNVMRELGMLTLKRKPPKKSVILRSISWLRAPSSGIARMLSKLGDMVSKGDVLAHVGDAGGKGEQPLDF